MAQRKLAINLAAILLATLCIGASSQSSSCTSAVVSLAPCLGYITGNDTTPSSSCCTQLAAVVQSEPQCLCMVLNGGASSLGITINQTTALALPGACKVQTPPVGECKSNGGSPSGSSPSSPSVPSAPSGGGLKNVPTADSSDGSSLQSSFTLILSLLLVVAGRLVNFSPYPIRFLFSSLMM